MGACLFFFLGMSLFIQYNVHCFDNKIGSLYKKNSTISFIVLFKNHVNSTEGVRQPMSELFTIFDNFYKIWTESLSQRHHVLGRIGAAPSIRNLYQ